MGKLVKYNKYVESASTITPDEINERIKEIITNVIKTKYYFDMLKDSADYVFKLIHNQLPKNYNAFINEVDTRDNILSELLDDLLSTVETTSMIDDIDDIVKNLSLIEEYTKDNMDTILSGKLKHVDEYDDDDDDDGDINGEVDEVEYEEEEDDDIPSNNKKDNDEMDQLKPKNNPKK
jgi:hypothetical protein